MEVVPARAFLLMVFGADSDDAHTAKMMNTTAATFVQLRAKVLARWGYSPDRTWTLSLLTSGHEPTLVEGFGDLPEAGEVRGKRKTRAKLKINRG